MSTNVSNRRILMTQALATGGVVGPPSFVYQVDDNSWTGGGTATVTSSANAIGSAFATRRVVVMGRISNGNPYVLTGGTIGGVALDILFSDFATDASNAWFLASAVVPTGTTATAILTFTGGGVVSPISSVFTVDNSQLANPTSVVTSITTAAATTTITGTVAVLAGGSILAICNGSGTSTAPQVTGGTSSPNPSNDGTISNFYSSAHGNGEAVNASATVTETWTGSASAGLLLAAFR